MIFVKLIIIFSSFLQVQIKSNIAWECVDDNTRKVLVLFPSYCTFECQRLHHVKVLEILKNQEDIRFLPDSIPLRGCVLRLTGVEDERLKRKAFCTPTFELITYKDPFSENDVCMSTTDLTFFHMDMFQNLNLHKVRLKKRLWNNLYFFFWLTSNKKHQLFNEIELRKMLDLP